ncbi:MAG: hypothetical protein KJ043_07350 [Anaerolineae bacterium]|nr:hypothetical protein [Anaerolineae bacterium]
MNGLSNAGKRLFWLLLKQSRIMPRWFTRLDIARMLGRERLVAHDIRLLNELSELGLIEQKRRVKPNLPNGMPNGSEYVYIIPNNVLWACDELARQSKQPKQSAPTPNATPKPPQSAPTLASSIDLDKWLEDRRSKRRGLLGWLRGK